MNASVRASCARPLVSCLSPKEQKGRVVPINLPLHVETWSLLDHTAGQADMREICHNMVVGCLDTANFKFEFQLRDRNKFAYFMAAGQMHIHSTPE